MAAEATEVQASTHDRLKSFLGGASEPQPKATSAPREADPSLSAPEGREPVSESEPVPAKASESELEADQVEDSVDVQSDDAQSEDWKPSDLSELLTAAFGEAEKGFDLPVKVKIDGKEGTATLRDLVKSYQLDGHINQKLASVDTDRKALMAEREKFQAERADKLLKMDAGLKTLERALMSEFQSVDWQKLASEDPAAYNANLVAFQQRNAQLQDIAAQIAAEQQQFQTQQQEQMAAYLAEQKKLLQAKVPEWADDTARAKDKAEIAAYLQNYGISKEEFEAITDHRHALVVRDAWKWHQLQKSKPAVLNKVKAAPKLLKPGSQQSKDAVNRAALNKDRERLRQTGKLGDAVAPLRRIMFGR